MQGQPKDSGLMVAMLLALTTSWEQAEIRSGRRGEYRTTGASMFRFRDVTPEVAEMLTTTCGTLGVDVDEDAIRELFSGEFEFQISYACNRFSTRPAIGGQRLTSNEVRTLERAKAILVSKEQAATAVFTAPDRRVA